MLREALPWLQVGLVLLALSISLWVAASIATDHGGATYGLDTGSRVLGWLGALTVLAGLVLLARRSRFAMFGATAWCAELFLRFRAEFTRPVEAGLVDAAPIAQSSNVGPRLLLAAVAMMAISIAIPRLFRGDDPRPLRVSWNFTLVAFLVQILAALLLFAHARSSDISIGESWNRWRSFAPWNLGLVFAWLLFVAPYAHVVVSLRRTRKHNARRFVG